MNAAQTDSASKWIRFHGELREWCRGRWWVFRVLMLLWFAYMLFQYTRNPQYSSLFDAINLGIHELGHIIWSPLGEFMAFLGGSLTQCLAPVVSVALFYRQRDYFAMAFCFGWLATNLFGVSVYMADARVQLLPLVTPGGGEPLHDWFYLFNALGLLEQDTAIAMLVRVAAFGSMVFFLLSGAYIVWLMMTLSPHKPGLEDPLLDAISNPDKSDSSE